MRNTGVMSSLPWNKVSRSKCTMLCFLPLWSKPTTCAMHLDLEGKLMKARKSPTPPYISRNLIVEAKYVLKQNACDISIKVSYNIYIANIANIKWLDLTCDLAMLPKNLSHLQILTRNILMCFIASCSCFSSLLRPSTAWVRGLQVPFLGEVEGVQILFRLGS